MKVFTNTKSEITTVVMGGFKPPSSMLANDHRCVFNHSQVSNTPNTNETNVPL